MDQSRQENRHQPVSWYLVFPCYQEHIAQLLVLKVCLHLTEGLLCMICSLEKLIRGVSVHSGERTQNQPVYDKRQDRKEGIRSKPF